MASPKDKEKKPRPEHYVQLKLESREVVATLDEIKKAYRKLSLRCHPDKVVNLPPDKQAEAEKQFIALQEAYEALSDPVRKKNYDSQIEKPHLEQGHPESVEPEEFFDAFSPRFEWMGCFATLPSHLDAPPALGDQESSDSHVIRFYDFWHSFKSWRDWSWKGEMDLEEAENRDERRWMQRENKGAAKAAAREEQQRVHKLVLAAEANDPRLKRIREAAEQAKQDKKNMKKMRRRQAAEERLRQEREAEERHRKAAEEAERQKEAERLEKKRVTEAKRERRRTIRTAFDGSVRPESLQLLELAQLDEICGLIERMEVSKARERCTAILREAGPASSQWGSSTKSKSSSTSASAPAPVPESAPWSREELKLLAKLVARFPGGTPGRWAKIAEGLPTKRTVQELILRVKSSKSGAAPATSKVEAAAASAALRKGQHPQQPQELPTKAAKKPTASPALAAESKPSPKTLAPVAEPTPKPSAATPAAAPSSSPAAPAQPEPARASSKRKKRSKSKSKAKANGTPAAEAESAVKPPQANGTPTSAPKKTAAAAEWSTEQQMALEGALRESASFPADERWDRVAARVEGKSKSDCVKRFKWIRSQLGKKKAT